MCNPGLNPGLEIEGEEDAIKDIIRIIRNSDMGLNYLQHYTAMLQFLFLFIILWL